jgi:hypothetical protein
MYNHTPADGYVLHIAGHIRPADYPDLSPSDRVVRALQALDSRVLSGRFRSKVLDAISSSTSTTTRGMLRDYFLGLSEDAEKSALGIYSSSTVRSSIVGSIETLLSGRTRFSLMRPIGLLFVTRPKIPIH